MPQAEDHPAPQPPDAGRWQAAVERVLARTAGGGSPAPAPGELPPVPRLCTRAEYGVLAAAAGWPGSAPYLRGARAVRDAASADIRQRVDHPDPAQANRDLLEELEHGAHSALLAVRPTLDGDARDTPGTLVLDRDDAAAVLAGVHLDLAPVSLDAGGRCLETAALVVAAVGRAGHAAAGVRAALGVDPLGAWTRGRTLALEPAAALARHVEAAWPGMRTLRADGRPWHAAGAGEAQELALTLATAVDYLRLLDEAGLDPVRAAGQIEITLAADNDVFPAIAKLRALRGLWGRVLDEIDARAAWPRFHLHAETATRMLARCDPHVNLLRTTTAAFAALVGGADSITVLPFDQALGRPGRHGRRLARNIQHILLEESQLHRVADPAGGSWYVESLTHELMAAAWRLFQELEHAGGMAAALKAGLPQGWVAVSWAARAADLATMRRPITGVSAFAQLAAPMPAGADDDSGAAWDRARRQTGRAQAWSDLGQLLAIAGTDGVPGPAPEGAPVAALTPRRLAEGFEALRRRADDVLARTGRRPRAFLVTLGPPAAHAVRASFARNLLQAGGIEPVGDGALASGEAAAAAFKAAAAPTALICANDDMLRDLALPVAAALRSAGCRHLVLIGEVDALAGPLAALHADLVVDVGGDMLAALERLQAWSGIAAGPDAEMER